MYEVIYLWLETELNKEKDSSSTLRYQLWGNVLGAEEVLHIYSLPTACFLQEAHIWWEVAQVLLHTPHITLAAHHTAIQPIQFALQFPVILAYWRI